MIIFSRLYSPWLWLLWPPPPVFNTVFYIETKLMKPDNGLLFLSKVDLTNSLCQRIGGELWFWLSNMKISTYISRSRVGSLSVAWSSVWHTVNITSVCGKGADHLVVRSVALLRFLLKCVSGQQLYCLWTCCQPTYWIISPQFNYLPYCLVSLSIFWLSLLSGLLLIIISDFLWGFCFWVFL